MGVGLSDLVPKARLTVTIADGASLSGASDAITPAGCTIVGLLLPATWTAAKVSLLVSVDGGTTYAEAVAPGNGGDKFATATLTVVSSTPIFVPLDPAMTAAATHIKVKSGTLSSATAQTGEKVITLVTRPVS